MGKESYTIIPDWMHDLNLSLIETTILAVIHGFSMDGNSRCRATINYFSRKAHCTKRTVITSIAHLCELGYVRKEKNVSSGVPFCEYLSCVNSGVANFTSSENISLGGSEIISPNNIDNNIYNINNNIYPKETISKDIVKKGFDFGKRLCEDGADKEDVAYWMEVRRTKKAINTERAYNRFIAEVEKAGISVAEAVKFSAKREWKGFNVDWYNNAIQKKGCGKQENKSYLAKGFELLKQWENE